MRQSRKRRAGTQALAAALLAGAWSGLAAQLCGQEQVQEERLEIGALVEKVLTEYQAAERDFAESMQRADSLTQLECSRRMLEESPRPGPAVAQLLPALEQSPTHPEALRALLWAVDEQIPSELQARVFSLLLEHHADAPLLPSAIDNLQPTLGASQFLEALADKTKERRNRGEALYSLCRVLDDQIELIGMGDGLGDMFPEELRELYLDELESQLGETLVWAKIADPGPLEERRRQLLERVVADYSDISRGRFVEKARKDLETLARFSPGCPAPETSGTDVDGVEFGLAEYRGKVVVLDFWGHW